MLTIKIIENTSANPPGKLADAELHFTRAPAPPYVAEHSLELDVLDGLKLIGFGIWERRGGNGRNVTFPARQYSVNGERRSFALLRPITDADAQNGIRQLILEAYAAHAEQAEQDRSEPATGPIAVHTRGLDF